jgi:7,8-dihydroneopterin aldolase/epimerase/oxygenase
MTIHVNNIRLYAYHGCLPEEALIGSDYRVDVRVKADLRLSMQSDDLADTVDYVSLTAIVKQEMQQRSKLLEHVANRIAQRIMTEHQQVTHCWLRVAKLTPPIEADVEDVAVEWEIER